MGNSFFFYLYCSWKCIKQKNIFAFNIYSLVLIIIFYLFVRFCFLTLLRIIIHSLRYEIKYDTYGW